MIPMASMRTTLPATRPLAPVEVSFVTIMELDQWLGVELRHFAALQAIAEEGTFGRAAQRLGYTQSAISQQIATLEKIVGEQLLARPGGPPPGAGGPARGPLPPPPPRGG